MRTLSRHPSREARDAAAWSPDVPPLLKDFDSGPNPADSLLRAAHFVAGGLEEAGFTLFRNGGLPLLEWRDRNLIFEIVVRPLAGMRAGSWAPASVAFHLSHQGVLELRRLYWSHAGKVPAMLAGGDLLVLECPPAYGLWNVSESELAGADMLASIRGLALPYLERCLSEASLLEGLIEGTIPLLEDATRLEWLMVDFGRAYAAEAFRKMARPGERCQQVAKRFDLGERRLRLTSG